MPRSRPPGPDHGYALTDSPAGLCVWITEKLWAWTDHPGELGQVLSADQVLDDITVYWLTGTGASSARLAGVQRCGRPGPGRVSRGSSCSGNMGCVPWRQRGARRAHGREEHDADQKGGRRGGPGSQDQAGRDLGPAGRGGGTAGGLDDIGAAEPAADDRRPGQGRRDWCSSWARTSRRPCSLQPTRGALESAVPADPTIYRFYEVLQVYGPTIKELIHEQFGDGIIERNQLPPGRPARTRPRRRPGDRHAGRQIPALPVVTPASP